MREDLIERLRKLIDDRCGGGPSGHNYDPELLDVLTEAAAALEAAREDAERYRFIAADHSAAWEEELDAAIDQARGKGGAGK